MNKQADATQQVGTPVTEWPVLTRAQAEELRGNKFYTVEQVAACSDGQIQVLGMNGNMLRQKARLFLESAKGSAVAQQQAEELQKKDQEISDLKQQMAALAQKVEFALATKPKKEKTPEERKAIGERLKAGREAKKAQGQVSG